MRRPAFNPVKPCDPELPKAVVRRLFVQAGGITRVAVRLGLKEPTVYALADPGVDDEITFARVAALTEPGNPAAAEYLAGLAGGFFQPVEGCPLGDAQSLTAAAAREHGEFIAVMVAALVDGKVTADEARVALPEIDDALRELCRLRAVLLATAAGTSES